MRLATALLLCAALATAGEDEAARLKSSADKLWDHGAYPQAVHLYQRLQEKFPQSPQAIAAQPRTMADGLIGTHDLEINGPPDHRVDVYILGDGFLLDRHDQRTFDDWAKGTLKVLMHNDLFKRYHRYFNFHVMNLWSAEDGVDQPNGKQYDTALDAKALGGQGQVYIDRSRVEEYLGKVKDSDGLAIVLVQKGVLGTGGGGIATTGRPERSTIVHEWGHAFGGLLDEYTFGAANREQGFGTSGPNISDTPDPNLVPWKAFLTKWHGRPQVKIIEGGAGLAKGRWRPTVSGCAMGAAGSIDQYCPVCRQAMIEALYRRVGAIDEAEPMDSVLTVPVGKDLLFRVKPMPVEQTPRLEVTWYLHKVGPKDELDPPQRHKFAVTGGMYGSPSGMSRVPRPTPRGDVVKGETQPDGWNAYPAKGLAAGVYEVYCMVKDPTPWVVEDSGGVLTDGRRWIVHVGERVTTPND